jgi:PAS domain-containing protein
VRRAGPNLPYPYFFWALGIFIVSCGATHFMEVITVWSPVYWLSVAVKIVTAAASAGAALVLLFAADDIVEFVRTAREAAAHRGNEQLRARVNASPMAVVSADLEGKVTVWNPARNVYLVGQRQRLGAWFLSGFPETELPANSVFLQKPFRFATLLEQLKLVRRRT